MAIGVETRNLPSDGFTSSDARVKAVIYKPRIINYANNTFTAYDSGWVNVVGDRNRTFKFKVPNYASSINSSVNVVQFKELNMGPSDGWEGWSLDAVPENDTAVYTLRTGSAGVTRSDKPDLHADYYRVRLLSSLAEVRSMPLPDYSNSEVIPVPNELSFISREQSSDYYYDKLRSSIWEIPKTGFYKFSLAAYEATIRLVFYRDREDVIANLDNGKTIGVITKLQSIDDIATSSLFDGYLLEGSLVQIVGLQQSGHDVMWASSHPTGFNNDLGIIFTPPLRL
jgi:hypothetical protein